MFRNLRNEIILLNADVKNVANSEKAKKLRKKLFNIGIPLTVIGLAGVFTCFVLFTCFGIQSVQEGVGFPSAILVPFFLIIPFAIMGSIGTSLISIASKIVITSYTANLVDSVVRDTCPNCGNTLNGNENFCSKCGTAVQKKCPKCGHINKKENCFCEQCGERID